MAKSIIDIEVKAEAFDKFAALFKQYSDQLAKMPGQWGKVGDAINKTVVQYDALMNVIPNVTEAQEELLETQQKSTKEQDKLNKHISSTAKTVKGMGSNMKNMLKDVTSTTMQLAKWTALGLTGAGGAGLFGVSALAGGASDIRRQAQGLGVTAGELRSSRVNFERYIDVNAALSNISQAQADPSKQWAFSAIGLNQGQSATKMLPQLMREAARVYREDPKTAEVRLRARGFGELGIDVATARRLASLKEEELSTAIKRAQQDEKMMEINDKVLRQWQDLDVQLDRSKNLIQQAFITGLTPLIPNIEKFSESVAEAIKIFLSNPDLGTWLEDFGRGIKDAAEWLAQFDFGKKHFAAQHAGQEEARRKGDIFTPKANAWMKDTWSKAISYLTGKGWSAEESAAIMGSGTQESSLNPQAKNATGHRGIFQWDRSRQSDFEKWAGFSLSDPRATMEKQLDFMDYEITQGKEKRAGKALKSAVGLEGKTRAFEATFERSGGADMEKRIGYANAAYAAHINSLRRNGVQVSMYNNTGGSATAVIGAAATPDLGFSAFAGQ